MLDMLMSMHIINRMSVFPLLEIVLWWVW